MQSILGLLSAAAFAAVLFTNARYGWGSDLGYAPGVAALFAAFLAYTVPLAILDLLKKLLAWMNRDTQRPLPRLSLSAHKRLDHRR